MISSPPSSPATNDFVLILRCPDRPGIVHAVTGYLVQQSANIIQSQQYGDAETSRFFLRVQFEVLAGAPAVEDLQASFAPIADGHAMTWQMWEAAARYNTLVLVSRFGHCLNDLLFRWSTGALQIEIPSGRPPTTSRVTSTRGRSSSRTPSASTTASPPTSSSPRAATWRARCCRVRFAGTVRRAFCSTAARPSSSGDQRLSVSCLRG